jgi:hypothetical protein
VCLRQGDPRPTSKDSIIRGPKRWNNRTKVSSPPTHNSLAGALGISTHELRICIAENRVRAVLLGGFREPGIAADTT